MATLPKSIGSYEVVRLLGKGGMGEVYLASHDLLDRHVALKKLSPRDDTSVDEMEERFLREILARNGGNRAATARALGIHKTTLWRKMKKLGIS